MRALRRLNDAGRQHWRDWLQTRAGGGTPPTELIDGAEWTEPFGPELIDETKVFDDRQAFGRYLVECLAAHDAQTLLASSHDGLWDWLTVVYFAQIGLRQRKAWHYSVWRQGHAGNLAYRHLVRTAFEMVWRHGDHAAVMLARPMHEWGDMAEQLTSRQDIAWNRDFIRMAHLLYVGVDGRLRRGAAARVRPVRRRKPGERTGRGGVGRLALAVQRLSRTYDTLALPAEALMHLLPKEFSSFRPEQ